MEHSRLVNTGHCSRYSVIGVFRPKPATASESSEVRYKVRRRVFRFPITFGRFTGRTSVDRIKTAWYERSYYALAPILSLTPRNGFSTAKCRIIAAAVEMAMNRTTNIEKLPGARVLASTSDNGTRGK